MDPSFVHLKEIHEYIIKAEDLKTQGNECFKKGETEKAIELYNEALQLDSRNVEYNSKILGNRSACREKLKLYHQAYDDICEALEINENNAKS
jgi:tetratricopeptide (TPR) repeat protein